MLAATELETDELPIAEAAERPLQLVAGSDQGLPAVDPQDEIGGDQRARGQGEELGGRQATIIRSVHDEAFWAFGYSAGTGPP